MKSFFNLLTFIGAIIFSIGQGFPVVTQLDNNTHLRWKIESGKEQVQISKKSQKVFIQTLDPDFFLTFSEKIAKLKLNKDYHSEFKFEKPTTPGTPYKLTISLKDSSVELFNFYKGDTNEYILDFWVNQDFVKTKKASSKPGKIKVAQRRVLTKKKPTAKPAPTLENVRKKRDEKSFKVIDPMQIAAQKKNGYRDFRYGSAFIWDYKPLIPPLKMDLDLSKKAPNFLYELKDVELLDDPKQAHMQLSINFYRDQDWGLMTRSIELYEKKYGKTDEFRSSNDFMRAVSMIKNTIKQKLQPKYATKLDEAGEAIPTPKYSNRGIRAAARNILSGIIENKAPYEMKTAVLRYLIQDARDKQDYIKGLEYAKKLYVESSESYDDDNTILSSRVILNSLAHLKQIDKIEQFLSNKVVRRLLPEQEGFAYIDYINLEKNDVNKVINNFAKSKKSFVKPVHPAIVFNVAEAYFRKAQYENAIKYFDEFIANYSFFTEASHARLRMALSFDLLDKDPKVVLKLYEDAINKSTDMTVRYEAKVRYVGLRVARKLNVDEGDKERMVFLEADESEKKYVGSDLKRLLWLTRLRSYINSGQLNDALAYTSTIPVDTFRPIDQNVFWADASEVVLGLIKENYMKEDYTRAVKVWETFRERYENRVTQNPYTSFVVADSYLKLGLYKSFERSIDHLKRLPKTNIRKFPLWIKAHKKISIEDYLVELNLNRYLKQEDFKGLAGYLEKVKSNKNVNYKFYKGLVSYHAKNYNEAVGNFEDLLVSPNLNNILSPLQNQKMVKAYLEALYEAAPPAKFRKNIVAVIQDLRNNSKSNMRPLLIRAEYLYMESLFSEQKVDYKRLGRISIEFLEENINSPYNNRVNYLKGISLINTENIEEGTKVLKELVDSKEVPAYLRGLAKSELSTLELKKSTL